jgi:hypothetical protein
MITRIDPENFSDAATVQLESDAANPWLALEEIENWAAANGFVRTSEYHPREVLIGGHRRFRGICYRLTDEEVTAIEQAHQHMIERGDALMRAAVVPEAAER